MREAKPQTRQHRGRTFVAVLASLSACRGAAPAPPTPPQVTVATIREETVPGSFEWVGQAEASKRVEVRAQVAGVIVARPYTEGTDVKRGAVLFRIDPTQYEAAYRSAAARLGQAEAQLGNADRNLARLRPLLAARLAL